MSSQIVLKKILLTIEMFSLSEFDVNLAERSVSWYLTRQLLLLKVITVNFYTIRKSVFSALHSSSLESNLG